MVKGRAVTIRVTVSARTVVTYSGRTLGHVAVDDHGLVVNKKRLRSSSFESCFYPHSAVVAYSEGDGGKDGTAYAVVREYTVLSDVTGSGVWDERFVQVVDDSGVVHKLSRGDGVDMSVVEGPRDDGAGDESALTDEPARSRPARRKRPEPEPEPARRRPAAKDEVPRSRRGGRDELDF